MRVLEHLAHFDLKPLAPPQVFLLLVAPFAHEAVWVQGLAWLHGSAHPEVFEANPDAREPRRTLQRTHSAYPRVVRLAERLGPPHRRSLTLWLLHRALDHLPTIWNHEQLPPGVNYEPMREVAGDAFAPLCRLLRCVGADVSQLDGVRDENDLVVAGTPVDQARLATLLIAAGAIALDVRAVDELAVYHVGGPEGFVVEHLVEAANQGHWKRRGTAWSFVHVCRDPVQHYCLVDLVDRADRLGKALRASGGALAHGLPAEIAATGVIPARDDANQELFRPIHVLFRLDHNRIRDLLMGEALYGDPTMALRELYQNALDACRYRRARNEYLRRANPLHDQPYTGRIVFRHGTTHDGRPFIECQDNGVGMSERMIEGVFAVAGQRFHDQPAYLIEKGRWEHYGIRLHPNSQHGIGVLSYFMLTDELEIETREFRADGRPGRPLHVRISSASGLFHVRNATSELECGTRIRMYPSRTEYKIKGEYGVERERELSVATILRELLIVAEFETEVREGVKENSDIRSLGTLAHHWEPGVPNIPPGERWALTPTDNPDLWWATDPDCPVLADGIRTKQTCAYALVNLRNERYPVLSADRTSIQSWNETWVSSALGDATVHLADLPGLSLVLLFNIIKTYPTTLAHWSSLVKRRSSVPLCTTRDLNHLYEGQHHIFRQHEGRIVNLTRLGFMPADLDLFQFPHKHAISAFVAWRLSLEQEWLASDWPRLYAANPRLEAAPSPPTTLGLVLKYPELVESEIEGVYWQANIPLVHQDTLQYQHLREIESSLRWACDVLGVPATHRPPSLRDTNEPIYPKSDNLTQEDSLLLSLTLNGEPPWLDQLPAAHVFYAARTLHNNDVSTVSVRLKKLARLLNLCINFDIDRLAEFRLEENDLTLLSLHLNGQPPWLLADVPAAHLLDAARALDMPISAVAIRLQELAEPFGLRIGFDAERVAEIKDSDWRLISMHLGGYESRLREEIPAIQAIYVTHAFGIRVPDAVAQLEALAPVLGLRLRPAVAFLGSNTCESLVAEVARLSEPAPYETFDARTCTQLWVLQAGVNINEGVDEPAHAILCAGRWWLWWLTDNTLRSLGEILLPVIHDERMHSFVEGDS